MNKLKSISGFIGSKFRSLMMILAIFITGAGIAMSAAGDLVALPGSVYGTHSWRVAGPKSSEVLSSAVYANDLIPGVNASRNIGAPTKQVKTVFTVNESVSNSTLNRVTYASTTVTANTTLTVSNTSRINIGSLSGNITLTIPSAVTAGAGAELVIQDIGGTLDATHTCTVNSTSGNLNGASTFAFATAYMGKVLKSNGTNWFVR